MRCATRLIVVGTLLALLTASCGSSGEPAEGSGEGAASGEAGGDVAAASAALVDRWDQEGAFFVVAWSLDRGYTPEQIVDGAPADLVDPDGTIRSESGSLLTPDREPAGLLTALEARGLPGLRLVLASTGLPVAGLLAADESPVDAYVGFLDASLGEIFAAGKAAVEKQQADEQFEAEVAELALLLARRGYSLEQIMESMWFGDVMAPGPLSPCWSIVGEKGPAKPDFSPVDAVAELECLPAEEAAAGVSTTTSTAAPPAASSDSDIDGTYSGGISAIGEVAGAMTVLDSRAEITISEGIADVTLDVTFEAIWVRADELSGEGEDCVSSQRFVLTGTGPAEPSIQVDLRRTEYELLAISGCEIDEDEDDETLPFSATVNDGVLTGSFFNDVFVVTAKRG